MSGKLQVPVVDLNPSASRVVMIEGKYFFEYPASMRYAVRHADYRGPLGFAINMFDINVELHYRECTEAEAAEHVLKNIT